MLTQTHTFLQTVNGTECEQKSASSIKYLAQRLLYTFDVSRLSVIRAFLRFQIFCKWIYAHSLTVCQVLRIANCETIGDRSEATLISSVNKQMSCINKAAIVTKTILESVVIYAILA